MSQPKTSQSASSPSTPILECRSIRKQFPGVLALKGVNLSLDAGEVLGLVGENGAGKSTLMKILAGVQPADAGEILVDGQLVQFRSVRDAQRLGIALIHQELNLAANLTVAANVFLGCETTRFGFLARGAMEKACRPVLQQLGLEVSPNQLVERLAIGQRQLVEIAKALSMGARVLIMDEPTSSLSQRETVRLLKVIESLRASGVSVIYISHRLGEIQQIADRVTVLRDGENAGDLLKDETSHDAMVRLMVGRDISDFYPRTERKRGRVVLSAKQIRTNFYPKHEVSLDIHAGEIVGLAGLVGAGRSELLETIFGARKPISGTVKVDGNSIATGKTHQAIAAGVAFASEDRKKHGLILPMSVRHNISLAQLARENTAGFIRFGYERDAAREMIGQLRIKTPSDRQMVGVLSGGNQQKVVFGKWLCTNPKVLLLDEPTRGVDVGAKREIYALMDRLAGEGVAVLFVSSDLEEVLGMSDRTLVMHEGRLAGEILRENLSEQSVMHLATGGEAQSAK